MVGIVPNHHNSAGLSVHDVRLRLVRDLCISNLGPLAYEKCLVGEAPERAAAGRGGDRGGSGGVARLLSGEGAGKRTGWRG